MERQLLILGCSQAKRQYDAKLPALEVYDGPNYRVLRKFLREYRWPQNVAVSTLSAKHGLFGSIKEIEHYDQRMDHDIARAIADNCDKTLQKWAGNHGKIHVALGKDYLPAIQPSLDRLGIPPHLFQGGIGSKQSQVRDFLLQQAPERRATQAEPERKLGRLTYFLPDWDDLLDLNFDFERDQFSGALRADRGDEHCHRLMQPTEMCDGILVSLAQRQTAKGPLRKLEGTEAKALTPVDLRQFFGLHEGQYLFGDCGAFSYVSEAEPTISTEQAVALYELYNFNLGASVDHIPIKTLPESERQRRVEITVQNADAFIKRCKERGRVFTPVGTMQGTSPEQYARNVARYCEMGYHHLAIGGLVPLTDAVIAEIVEAVATAADKQRKRPWLHLFGIYRPKLQAKFQELGIDSFDSASYYRKSWLRSDQNYLGADGKWYAAIRVRMTGDPRTRKHLAQAGADIAEAEQQEQRALRLLADYEKGLAGIDETLEGVLEYDQRLHRASDTQSMRERYRRTLEAKPWLGCDCTFCQKLGIHILIFRGGNRNKRRGAHNTAKLYRNTVGPQEISI